MTKLLFSVRSKNIITYRFKIKPIIRREFKKQMYLCRREIIFGHLAFISQGFQN